MPGDRDDFAFWAECVREASPAEWPFRAVVWHIIPMKRVSGHRAVPPTPGSFRIRQRFLNA